MWFFLWQNKKGKNIIPNMTADTTGGFKATSSSLLGWMSAYYAFRTNNTTDSCLHSSNIWAGNWMTSVIETSWKFKVEGITVRARKDSSDTNKREPKALKLSWSDDGTTYIELRSATWMENNWNIWWEYHWDISDSTESYKFLKLELQANRSYVAIDHWNVDGVSLRKDRGLENCWIWAKPPYKRKMSDSTLSYFPFKEDFVDKTGNRTLTVKDVVIQNSGAYFQTQAAYMLLSSAITNSQITINTRFYYWGLATSWWWNTLFCRNGWTNHHVLFPATTSGWTIGNIGTYNGGWQPSSKTLTMWKWYNIISIKSWNTAKMYVNWEKVLDITNSFDNSVGLGLIGNYATNQSQWPINCIMSEVILESRIWDEEECKKYYESTKDWYK